MSTTQCKKSSQFNQDSVSNNFDSYLRKKSKDPVENAPISENSFEGSLYQDSLIDKEVFEE